MVRVSSIKTRHLKHNLKSVYIESLKNKMQEVYFACDKYGIDKVVFEDDRAYAPVVQWLMFVSPDNDSRFEGLREIFLKHGVSVLEGTDELVLDGNYVEYELSKRLLGIDDNSLQLGSFLWVLPFHKHLGVTYIHARLVRFYIILLRVLGVHNYDCTFSVSELILNGTYSEVYDGVSFDLGKKLGLGIGYNDSSLSELEPTLMGGRSLTISTIMNSWLLSMFRLAMNLGDMEEQVDILKNYLETNYSVREFDKTPYDMTNDLATELDYWKIHKSTILKKEIGYLLNCNGSLVNSELCKNGSNGTLIFSTDEKGKVKFGEYLFFHLVLLDNLNKLRGYLGISTLKVSG